MTTAAQRKKNNTESVVSWITNHHVKMKIMEGKKINCLRRKKIMKKSKILKRK